MAFLGGLATALAGPLLGGLFGGGKGGGDSSQPAPQSSALNTLASILGPAAAEQVASQNLNLSKGLTSDALTASTGVTNNAQNNLQSIYGQYQDPATMQVSPYQIAANATPSVTPQTMPSVFGVNPGDIPAISGGPSPYAAQVAALTGGGFGGGTSPFAVRMPTSAIGQTRAPAASSSVAPGGVGPQGGTAALTPTGTQQMNAGAPVWGLAGAPGSDPSYQTVNGVLYYNGDSNDPNDAISGYTYGNDLGATERAWQQKYGNG